MNETTYSLKELCREAQVTERTVRYYKEEGLLPPSEGAGPFARYNRTHLLLLRLIRRLKEEYLPLAEIRRRLEKLDPAQLEDLAQETEFKGEYDEEEADAKNYLDRLLSKSDSSNGSPASSRRSQTFGQGWPAPPQYEHRPPGWRHQQTPPSTPKPGDQTEIWQRIKLAPGVELHFQSLEQEQQEKVDRLLEQARRIFRP